MMLIIRYGLLNFETSWVHQKTMVFIQIRKRQKKKLSIYLKHPQVYTLGHRANKEYISFCSNNTLVNLHRVDRGGEVTYHDYGQVIIYNITHLQKINRNVNIYIANLEQLGKRILLLYKTKSTKKEKFPGIWIQQKKIVALGIKIIQRTTFHGLSINFSCSKRNYELILACGIKDGISVNFNEIHKKNSQNQFYWKYKIVLLIVDILAFNNIISF
uniref:Probable octanoyltransferase n=1 Tax=Cyanidium caldarium TaxID=2771 RepID=LIPB_CYACA|nr:lipoate biosynthesis protein B [Cyanidium caldarium]O19898.1 RecName: Full=Probable octanoyltransferase; AltName: Full=Lipoate-protein ligase B; AltName: Full=Lipoyl/octanoyl transferase; AltName: Full=Octanoyl-[acyl-carrier-protein]-protein N-octanoyltransferase [Cyanidium caldarium]AAB82691.1 unknown [Cyanidium caldarium]